MGAFGFGGIGGFGNFAALVFTAAIAENIVLAKMLGLCPFAGLSRRLDVAIGVGAATCAVLTLASVAAHYANMLIIGLPLLRPMVFIAIASGAVAAAELLMRLFAPVMHRALGLYLPLIATNCAVLGVMLLAAVGGDIGDVGNNGGGALTALARGFGGGLGFMLAVVVFALLRGRVVESLVPPVMRGAPLAMITAGWMALAFSALP